MHGHAVIISGPAGQGGAARLAARGALRIGAGVVSVLSAADAVAEHAAQLNAIMVKTYDRADTYLDRLIALKPSAICIGPGLGLGDASLAKLQATLTCAIPMCIDADAITLIAANKPHVLRKSTVMTPHEGEMRRLIPHAFEQTTCRVSLAQIAAKAMGCVVLFKGADTVIAQPSGAYKIVTSQPFEHAAWLATAGSGDVLSGIITGLLARGCHAADAAAVGAHLHLQCADAFGPGLIAEDIPEMLPRILAQGLSRARPQRPEKGQ
ncbi:MAG: NAD(P)H-hydrate dehydratase [Yoonia sp.]|nr:NAD(P)H-hydrate dehydratase [Yoonia sp.]